jgi:hypothetical protein
MRQGWADLGRVLINPVLQARSAECPLTPKVDVESERQDRSKAARLALVSGLSSASTVVTALSIRLYCKYRPLQRRGRLEL